MGMILLLELPLVLFSFSFDPGEFELRKVKVSTWGFFSVVADFVETGIGRFL